MKRRWLKWFLRKVFKKRDPGKRLIFHEKGVPMEMEKKTYLTILLNVKTKEVEGAFRTDLESIDENMKTLPVEKLDDVKDTPNLSEVKETHCATIFYTNPTLWIMVNGRLRAITV